MKPGYKTIRGRFYDGYECIAVVNNINNNSYEEYALYFDDIPFCGKNIIGVWTKKGTKRPGNWPVKSKTKK